MYDNGVGVLSQYGLTAITTCKGRGAMLCETETGWKSIQEFGGARNKLELQCQLQEQLMRSGAVQTDCPLRNETGELVSQGEDGLFYVVREWHPGKECDTRSIPEIRRAASAMARLHKAACLPLQKGLRAASGTGTPEGKHLSWRVQSAQHPLQRRPGYRDPFR